MDNFELAEANLEFAGVNLELPEANLKLSRGQVKLGCGKQEFHRGLVELIFLELNSSNAKFELLIASSKLGVVPIECAARNFELARTNLSCGL